LSPLPQEPYRYLLCVLLVVKEFHRSVGDGARGIEWIRPALNPQRKMGYPPSMTSIKTVLTANIRRAIISLSRQEREVAGSLYSFFLRSWIVGLACSQRFEVY
jgi:hypothetical protein